MIPSAFRFYILLCLSFIVTYGCGSSRSIIQSGDSSEPLFRFKEGDLVGYKSTQGQTIIKPRFSKAHAQKLEDIMIVSESKKDQDESFYLTRSGKKLNNVKAYKYGKSYECENEGFIRFKDPDSDMVGLFNKDGKVVIPAEYNDLSQVHFGLVRAYKNAEKQKAHNQTYSFGYKYYQDHLRGGCNHINWIGGDKQLLNTKNELLIEKFNHKGRLDFSSLIIQEEASENPAKESFLGTDGSYYVFTNIEKDFEQWIAEDFLRGIDTETLIMNTMDSIMHADKEGEWTVESKSDFYDKNAKEIINRLSGLSAEKLDYRVRLIELNPKAYNRSYFSRYYNNCGQSIKAKYPVLELRRDDYSSDKIKRTVLRFLKTDTDYKIIDVRLE